MVVSRVEYIFFYASPIGCLRLRVDGDDITQVSWLTDDEVNMPADLLIKKVAADVRQNITLALDGYFESGLMIQPDISLQPKGTVFQQRVWQTIKKIPFGCTRTYGTIAQELQINARAVGQVCRINHIPIFIPCHRVVAANGIGGFMGGHKRKQMERKRWLLYHEGII